MCVRSVEHLKQVNKGVCCTEICSSLLVQYVMVFWTDFISSVSHIWACDSQKTPYVIKTFPWCAQKPQAHQYAFLNTCTRATPDNSTSKIKMLVWNYCRYQQYTYFSLNLTEWLWFWLKLDLFYACVLQYWKINEFYWYMIYFLEGCDPSGVLALILATYCVIISVSCRNITSDGGGGLGGFVLLMPQSHQALLQQNRSTWICFGLLVWRQCRATSGQCEKFFTESKMSKELLHFYLWNSS